MINISGDKNLKNLILQSKSVFVKFVGICDSSVSSHKMCETARDTILFFAGNEPLTANEFTNFE